LDAKNSALATDHSELLKGVEGDPWLELILVMLYENGQSTNSNWKPYFDVLPAEGQFDTLMYWDDAELRELEASAVVNKIGKGSADKTFREKIWPSVKTQPERFGFDSDVEEPEVLQAAHRMGSLIMAYAFDIESEREREIDEEGYVSEEEDEDMPKAMVPLADMLNADADRNNARLFYEPDALVMKAVKDIAKGEEIFNDYGPLPRSDLLRRYGYITDNYAKYDVAEIPSGLILQSATEQLKLNDEDIEQRVGRKVLFGVYVLIDYIDFASPILRGDTRRRLRHLKTGSRR
jgi:SET domain-containing protein 6